MADVVKVVPPTLLEASSQVAQHIEVAAKPPTAAAPPPAAASPGSAWRDGLLLGWQSPGCGCHRCCQPASMLTL